VGRVGEHGCCLWQVGWTTCSEGRIVKSYPLNRAVAMETQGSHPEVPENGQVCFLGLFLALAQAPLKTLPTIPPGNSRPHSGRLQGRRDRSSLSSPICTKFC
jgi:hypothetical protein